jgi:hypothetical protein
MVDKFQFGAQDRNPPRQVLILYGGGISGCQGTEGVWIGRAIVPGSYLPHHQRYVNMVGDGNYTFSARPETTCQGVSTSTGCSRVGLADRTAQAVTATGAEGRATTIHRPPGEVVAPSGVGYPRQDEQQGSSEQDNDQFGFHVWPTVHADFRRRLKNMIAWRRTNRARKPEIAIQINEGASTGLEGAGFSTLAS